MPCDATTCQLLIDLTSAAVVIVGLLTTGRLNPIVACLVLFGLLALTTFDFFIRMAYLKIFLKGSFDLLSVFNE
jgi:hypothetical protein